MIQFDFPEDIAAPMSKLLSDLKADLQVKNDRFIREIVVLCRKNRSDDFVACCTKPRAVVYLEDYDNLPGQLDVLENYGYIRDAAPMMTNRVYRMTEEFARTLYN